MIRLKDIAEKAGVSLMTVSKVLRDAPDVSAATKARVRRLAEELGYVPNALARGLRTRLSKLLGLVLPTLTHPVLGPAASALQDKAHEFGYDLLVAQTQDDPAREEVCVRRLLARRVDGLFLAPVYRLGSSSPIYQELQASRTPAVLLGPGPATGGDLPSVETDEGAGTYELVKHLIGLGHRQIAFFTGPSGTPGSHQQLAGYRRCLRDHEIPFEDKLIFSAGADLDDGMRAAEQMLGEATAATAVINASDLVAVGAGNTFTGRGLKVPEGLSLAGFGDYPIGEFWQGGLTTVRPAKYAAGAAAAAMMFRLLRGDKVTAQLLPSELVIRASTGVPSAEAALSPPRAVPVMDSPGDEMP